MKKVLLILFVAGMPLISKAQINIDLNSQNQFLKMFQTDQKSKYEGVSGNPFIIKDWSVGKTITSQGQSKEEIDLLYDLVENALLTKEGDKLMSFGPDVVGFTIKDPTNGNYRKFTREYLPNKDFDAPTYLEELTSGKLTLLKLVKKKIATSRNYDGSSSKSIEEVTRYYLATTKASPLAPTKLDKNEFLAVMADKKQEVNDYISKEKLNVKKENDAVKLVAYYNTL